MKFPPRSRKLFDDVDFLVSYSSGNEADDEKTVKEMQADPLLSKIPAVAKGNIAFLDNGPIGAAANPSPLSISWGIERYFDALDDGLEKLTMPSEHTTRTPSAPPAPATTTTTSVATLVFAVLLAALAVATVCSIMFGVRSISASDALAALGGATDTAGQAAASARIPRTVMAIVVGAALATAGTTLQAITRNPLADPGIFGILAGASLAVVVGLAFFGLTGTLPTMLLAVCGAFAAATFVYAIGSLGRVGATPLKLALSGAATTAALTSLNSAVLLPRAEVMDQFRFWQIGSVGGAQWETLLWAAPLLILGAIVLLLSGAGLNALSLGDDIATALGIPVGRTRLITAIGAVLLCGTATAMAGPIAFVGLIVPHFLRLIVGTDHRVLIPASMMAGAVLLTAADTLGRVINNPNEVAVGIITPLIGAPVFIWLASRVKVGEL